MSLPVGITPEADIKIRLIDDWWRTNRAGSPDLFADELASSFDIIGHIPNIDRLYRRSPVKGTRRLLLKGSRYHVYYVPIVDHVNVLAVWHGQRGAGAKLLEQPTV